MTKLSKKGVLFQQDIVFIFLKAEIQGYDQDISKMLSSEHAISKGYNNHNVITCCSC